MELISIVNNMALLEPQTASAIAEYERTMKVLKDKEDTLKKAILAEMEAKNIVKIDTPDMTISYIAPTDRETFDSKAFRKEHADMYDDYVKFTPVKSSIRIKVKSNE
jgi:hypothetical protein